MPNTFAKLKRRAQEVVLALALGAHLWTPFALRYAVYQRGMVGIMATTTASFALFASTLRSTMAYAQATNAPVLSTERRAIQEEGRALVKDPRDLMQPGPNGSVILYPNGGSPIPLTPQQLLQAPDSSGNYEDPRSYEGDNGAILGRAYDDAEALDAETQPGGTPTWRGEAYRTVQGSNNRAHPDARNDPVLSSSRNVLANQQALQDTFSSCDVKQISSNSTITNHVPDYQYCERINTPQGQSTLIHKYTVSPLVKLTGREGRHINRVGEGYIEPIPSQSGADSCGDGCMYVYLGQVGNNYWAGSKQVCDVYEQTIELELANPLAITSAVLDYAKWDDHIQVIVNQELVYEGPYPGNFPPEKGRVSCELSEEWKRAPNVDLTSLVQQGEKITFQVRVAVGGKGEGYARLRLIYDTSKLITDEGYTPEAAIDDAQRVGDIQCKSSAITPVRTPTLDSEGCGVVNNVKVCPHHFSNVPSPNINPVWEEMLITTASCNPTYGTYCWKDMQGKEQCYTQTAENSTGHNCQDLESNPKCAFVSSSCVKGAMGESGRCYVDEEKYDCGYDVSTSTYNTQNVTVCEGAIQCIGNSCIQHDNPPSESYANAVASLSAVKQIASDSECSETTGKCFTFPGKSRYCRNAMGGIQNCCKGGEPPSVGQYIMMLNAMDQVNTAVQGLEIAQPLYGAWNNLASTVSENFSQYYTELTKPFASVVDSIMGTTASTAGPAASDVATQGLIDQFKQELMNKAAALMQEYLGPEVANLFFEAGAAGTGDVVLSQGAQQALNVAGYFMAAYTAYVVAMMLIQIIWECTKEEIEMVAMNQLKTCHKVGSYCHTEVLGQCIEKRNTYCCYNSPLSRIIMEQALPQLGRDFGPVEDPICDGVSVEDVSKIDFSKVDLSEWIALLTLAGELPDAQGNTVNEVDLNSMTGQGSSLDTGEFSDRPNATRMNSAERARSRVESTNPNDVRDTMRDQFWNSSDEQQQQPPP